MSSSPSRVRPADLDDLESLVRIYNHYVTKTHHTFDTEVVTIEQRRPWFDGFADTGPHRLLVAESRGQPIGYASSRPFRTKPAYATSVETTIYLDPEFMGRGVGPTLYSALLTILMHEENVHRAYAGIARPNPASIAMHERLGFSLVGTFVEVGFKFAKYWDVSWYEKDLS